jgi:hypothetical protein
MEERAMAKADRVVRALLTAVATLEDLAQLMPDSTTALSTLEGVAFELGEMETDEYQSFVTALNRIAMEEPDRAEWIHGLPGALGIVDRS